jgi:hypothetical protein
MTPDRFWHGVGGFPEGDQLAPGIGQFRKLEWCLRCNRVSNPSRCGDD